MNMKKKYRDRKYNLVEAEILHRFKVIYTNNFCEKMGLKDNIGGYIDNHKSSIGITESEKVFSQEGNCLILNGAYLHEDARVSGDAIIDGAYIGENCSVTENAQLIGSDIYMYDRVHISGNAKIFGNSKMSTNVHISGNVVIDVKNSHIEGRTIFVTPIEDITSISGDVKITGDGSITLDRVRVKGNGTIRSNKDALIGEHMIYD